MDDLSVQVDIEPPTPGTDIVAEEDTLSTPVAPVPVRPLSSLQERKLVEYLEEQFLDVTRNYKKRSDPSSSLPTLAAYLEATHRLLSFILQIPPVDPSTPLRTALLLRLTSEVLQSIPGYAPDPNTLPALLAWLRDLDAGWLATLRADAWDSNASAARPARISSPPPPDAGGEDALDERRREARVTRPSQTERTRLRSALLAGTDALEEWLERLDAGGAGEGFADALQRVGLEREFDDLFAGTLAEMGSLAGSEPVPSTKGMC